PEHGDGGQSDPGQVLRRAGLAAGLRPVDGADDPAPDLPVGVRAPQHPRGEGGATVTSQLARQSRRQQPSRVTAPPTRTSGRTARIDRPSRVAVAFTMLFFAVLYLPIAVVVLFSFNSSKSLAVFHG